jgi:hypothetical protein
MKNLKIYFSVIALLVSVEVFGQHEGHQQKSDSTMDNQEKKLTYTKIEEHKDHPLETSMTHAFSRNLPMNRNGSGTSWLPDASPMYGYMYHSRKWMYMLHGSLYLRYNNQNINGKGSKGGSMIDAPNWVMAMGQTTVGTRGLFRFSGMFSLEPLTIGGEGYPLLYQNGETWEGKPLVNRQHPHDLISELSVGYTHMITPDMDINVYVGYPGEPAFGPVAFMHRPSAFFNPDAPLGHHWQDATHITFGVATVGFRFKDFKIEASSFTGREPNENRYDFDKPRFDSWSARLSYNPSIQWAFQISKARLKSPEGIYSHENVDKLTASVVHSVRFGSKMFWNTTALWGYNDSGHGNKQNSALLESAYTIFGTTLYAKYEWVEKSREDLSLEDVIPVEDKLFSIHGFTIGLNQSLLKLYNTHLSVGIQGTFYSARELDGIYGNNPKALEAYLRLYPSLMSSGLRNSK